MTSDGRLAAGRQRGEARQSAIVLLFALAAAAIVAAAYQAFSHYAAALRVGAEEDLSAIVRVKASQIEDFLRERNGDAEVLAQRAAIAQALVAGTRSSEAGRPFVSLPELAEATRHAYGYTRIAIFDRRLRAIYPPGDGDADPAETAALRRAIESRGAALADMHRAAGGEIVFGVARPVFDKGGTDGDVVGAVLLEVSAAHRLYPLTASWPSAASASGEIALVQRVDGGTRLLTPLRHTTELSPLQVRGVEPGRKLLADLALASPGGIVRDAVDYRGRTVLGASRRVAGTDWLVLAKVDAEEVEANEDDLRRTILALAAAFVLLAATVSYLLWRQLTQEISNTRERLAQRYFSAIESSLDGYARIDRDGRLMETNRVLRGWLGYERSELNGRSIAELQFGAMPDLVAATMQRIAAEGAARFQARWRRRDGSLIDLDVSAVHAPAEDGSHSFAYLRDISESLALTRRLQRLNLFYAFLTRINHALAGLREPAEILRAVCEQAVSGSDFLLAWGGIVDADGRSVRVVAKAGTAAGYAEGIELSVDPATPAGRGPTGVALREGRTEVANDFARDPRTEPWRERARHYGIAASAVTPVTVAGRPVGAITFYAGEPGYFDPEMVSLLEEAARSVALAWEAGIAEREKALEQARRAEAEARYATIFQSSPLPMQVMSIATREVVAINGAHERLFGYPLEEVRHAEDWFGKVYANPEGRETLRALWASDLARAATGARAVESPELRVRRRDGNERIVRGYLTIAGDDAIVAWSDLTELRRQDQALRESERRFRSMVEQAVSGFYVVRDDRFVYVNPQFAALAGYAPGEMVGMDPLDFVLPEDRGEIIEGRRRHYAGEKVVAFQVRARRKDGTIVVVRVNGAVGAWDGAPAIIALVEDITEKARAEQQIRDYIGRLERSIHATLGAVARMVDLRDPYTAGHERRVGLIAAAIARELGWDEPRARMMEMVGLVHDIGKIAVPAEILAKPTRLTASEFELVKGHAQAGYEILKDVEFDQLPVAEIIREHHERMDGSGYPQGLKAEQILPEARVLAVADVLESMASHRPYRPALGLEAALGELQKNRGRLYSADCVDAALRLYRDKGERLPE